MQQETIFYTLYVAWQQCQVLSVLVVWLRRAGMSWCTETLPAGFSQTERPSVTKSHILLNNSESFLNNLNKET